MPDIIKPRPRSLAIVRRVIGRDVTVRDVTIGVVRRRWWWVVLYVAVLLVPTVFAEVAMIPIIGVLAVPLSLVVFFGGNYLLTYLFPDAHGVRALGVTADSLVVVRYGGVPPEVPSARPSWERQRALFRASLKAALTLDEAAALVRSAGMAGASVRMTSDRHWTLAYRKP